MPRRWNDLVTALGATAVLAGGAWGTIGACGGGGPVCGDGVPEPPEQCDDGNAIEDDGCTRACRVVDTNDVTVRWSLVAKEHPGFNETCGGVGAKEIDLVFTGGPDGVRTMTFDCSYGSTVLRGFKPGDYQVTGILYAREESDAGPSRTALTKGLATAAFTVSEGDQTVDIDFGFADFVRTDYVGTYYFRTKFGGAATCQAASPPVVWHVLRLERDGAPLPGVTDRGDPIDGSQKGDCRDTTELGAQSIENLPWGRARMTIEGIDQGNNVAFRGTWDTFIGAGKSNPEFVFEVPSTADPDAGVDAL